MQSRNRQPINTAPIDAPILVTDGTDIAVYEYVKLYGFEPYYCWTSHGVDGVEFDLTINPTHWMPLPLLPGKD